MADPNAGAFGIGATVCLLVLRWAALSALAPSVLLLSAVWCLSRTVMAVVTRAVPYARAGGLATPFLAHGDADVAASRPAHAGGVAVVGLAVAVPLAALGNGWPGVASLAVAAAAGALVVAVAVRRIGGFTGDVLGAAGMVAETAGLLVAAARW
jgi:adenosylcobinamide-GDP ribazoletransferase